MKMPKALFDELQIAINAVGGLPANATERQRWNALWCAVDNRFFAVNRLYDAGLKDRHIDTALCEISVIRPTQSGRNLTEQQSVSESNSAGRIRKSQFEQS